MALVIKNPPANIGDVRDMLLVPGLEKGVATHSSILAWRIPWTEQPGWLQSIGFQRVDTTEAYLACMHKEVSCLFDIIHIFVRNGYYRIRFFFLSLRSCLRDG